MSRTEHERLNQAETEIIHIKPRFFFFLISRKDFIKKAKAPQKYIGYIQEELLARKRKAGKKNLRLYAKMKNTCI
jgi:hypothetical protein